MPCLILILICLLCDHSFTQSPTPIPEGILQACQIQEHPVKWKKCATNSAQNTIEYEKLNIPVYPISGFNQKRLGKIKKVKIHTSNESLIVPESMVARDNSIYNILYLTKKHGLPQKGAFCLDSDKDGKIYFGGGSYFNIYNGKLLKSFVLPKGITGVSDIKCIGSQVWIATRNGLLLYEHDSLYLIDMLSGISTSILSIDAIGNLWISTDTDHAFILGLNQNLTQLIHPKVKNNLKKMFEDKNGEKWLGFDDGIIRMSLKDTLFYDFKSNNIKFPLCFKEFDNSIVAGVFLDGIVEIKGEVVRKIKCGVDGTSVHDLEVLNGHLWIASYGNGLKCILEDKTYLSFGADVGLPSNGCHRLCSDKFGNLWISDIQSGLIKFKEKHFQPSTVIPKLENITQVSHFTDTTWYFRSLGAPIIEVKGQYYEMQIPSDYEKVEYHYSGDFDGPSTAWIQSYDGGFVRYHNNTLYSYLHSNIENEYQTHYPCIDKWGRVWATSFHGALKYLTNDTVHDISKEFNSVSKIIKGKEGHCYFSNLGQVFIIDESTFNSTKDSINNIQNIYMHYDHGIWAYKDAHIYHLLNQNVLKQIDLPDLKNLEIYDFLHASKDQIYFSCSKGVYSYDLKSKEGVWLECSYLMLGGRLMKIDDELMMINGRNHVCLKPNWNSSPSPKTYLEIVETCIDGIQIRNAKEYEIDPDEEISFEVDYTVNGQDYRIEYSLESEDRSHNWQALSSNSITLSNLSPGSYVLRIRSINGTITNKEIVKRINVKNYWYQSIWFYIGLSLLIILALTFIFMIRLRIANNRRRVLENIVKEKTTEIAQEKTLVEKELKDKEVLLKEVNHRVKNNMQMISSLLQLQNSKISDPASKLQLESALKRIKALSIAHQHLYQNEQYETIELNKYLSVIVSSFKIDETIKIDMKVDSSILTIERAQALGLILNELVQNSLKHAWKHDTENKYISINLNLVGGTFTLKYKDNGDRDNMILDGNGLGRKLIHSISKRQLLGKITEHQGKGYSAIITFKED